MTYRSFLFALRSHFFCQMKNIMHYLLTKSVFCGIILGNGETPVTIEYLGGTDGKRGAPRGTAKKNSHF